MLAKSRLENEKRELGRRVSDLDKRFATSDEARKSGERDLSTKSKEAARLAKESSSQAERIGTLEKDLHDGRERFESFPDLIADDAYIRALFSPAERTTVESAVAQVRAPLRLRELIKSKTRSRMGLYQLHQRFPGLFAHARSEYRYGLAVWQVATRPYLWPCLPFYLLVNLTARVRARLQLATIDAYSWERDDSTRTEQGPDPSSHL